MLCLSTSLTDCVSPPARGKCSGLSFASARPLRIASTQGVSDSQRAMLCLSTSLTDCVEILSSNSTNSGPLPQHVPYGLRHQRSKPLLKFFTFASALPLRIASANMHKNIRFFGETCCELVDSFSGTQTLVPALAIFPNSSAAKATYVAINDSLGRTIDRFCGANYTSFLC